MCCSSILCSGSHYNFSNKVDVLDRGKMLKCCFFRDKPFSRFYSNIFSLCIWRMFSVQIILRLVLQPYNPAWNDTILNIWVIDNTFCDKKRAFTAVTTSTILPWFNKWLSVANSYRLIAGTPCEIQKFTLFPWADCCVHNLDAFACYNALSLPPRF